MYKIFQENKTLIFPKIDGNALNLDATPQESDRYDAELLCEFLPEWLADRDQGDTFIHEVGENAVALALKEAFQMAPLRFRGNGDHSCGSGSGGGCHIDARAGRA